MDANGLLITLHTLALIGLAVISIAITKRVHRVEDRLDHLEPPPHLRRKT